MAVHQISEYGRIKSEGDQSSLRNNDIRIPKKSFNNLWDFILEEQSNNDSSAKAFDLYTKGGKRIIKAKNHVGVVETKSKDVIEILPKIYSIEKDDKLTKEGKIKETKTIFLKMLKVLKNFNNLSFQDANLQAKDDFPILELFINNYIIETEKLLLQGLKKDYIKNESNQSFLKGKLLFKQHLRHNLIDKSKFYVSFSRFEADIPINRIIKSTLAKLLNLTKSNSNRCKISRLSDILGDLPFSSNVTADINSIKNSNRLFTNYSKVIEWSEIFLLNKGFTNFSGKNINQAMLFPMEKVFESFVAYQVRRFSKSFSVSTQHQKFHLVEKYREKPKYILKPDIFASNTNNTGCIILDTKWKIISENLKDKSIDQSDMYQLYAYGRKYLKGYGEPVLYLIYPYSKKFTEELSPFYYEKEGNFWLKLYARPFDLRGGYEKQVNSLFESFNKSQENDEVYLPNGSRS